MKKKISIIIPVYNTEKYISDCLYSLINQTYKFFEIIIIDDGSNDNSYSICKKIADKDDRIRVYKQNNLGVSSARNNGINKCNGEYIMFIDSDDYLATNALEIISNFIDEDSLITYGYIKKFRKKEKIFKSDAKTYQNYNDMIECVFLDNSINGFLWNKLFSRKIIKNNNLFFDENIHYSEDLLFTLKYLGYCSKLINLNVPLYYYRMRKSGVSYKYINKKNTTILDSYKKILEEYADNIKIKNRIELLYLNEYWKFKKIYDDKRVIKSIIKREKEIIFNNKLSFKNILKYYIIYKNKLIYILFKSLKNKIEKTYD